MSGLVLLDCIKNSSKILKGMMRCYTTFLKRVAQGWEGFKPGFLEYVFGVACWTVGKGCFRGLSWIKKSRGTVIHPEIPYAGCL